MPLALFLLTVGAAWAGGSGHPAKGGPEWLFLGPCLFLFAFGCLGAAGLTALAAGRLDGLVALGERSARGLERRRALPVLWGVSATALGYAVIGVFSKLGLFWVIAVAALLALLALAGLGLGASALAAGRSLAAALGADTEPLPALRLGLTWLFAVSWLPVVGWGLLLRAVAAGMGGVLEALARREG